MLRLARGSTTSTPACIDIDLPALDKTLHNSLELYVALDFAALERSGVPELNNLQNRRRVKVRMSMHWVSERRISLDGAYDEATSRVVAGVPSTNSSG